MEAKRKVAQGHGLLAVPAAGETLWEAGGSNPDLEHLKRKQELRTLGVQEDIVKEGSR